MTEAATCVHQNRTERVIYIYIYIFSMTTEIPKDDALVRSRGSNIWIAASDGDLDRVMYLLEHEGVSSSISMRMEES